VLAELGRAAERGSPFRWLIDASHPFARRISAALAFACASAGQPLLRLERPRPAVPGATILTDLDSLAGIDLTGRHLLLAIGARRLAEAVAHSPRALHHARLLPHPASLRQAMAAGLGATRVAALRPPAEAGAAAAIEAALCRRWRIEVVLCRRSGGPSESHWRRICAEMGLRLLLLERPPEPRGATLLPLAALLERLGQAPGMLA
jgi:precorrin-6A/cobalt-precorrin-6A reductase